jgi:hypothetical protein
MATPRDPKTAARSAVDRWNAAVNVAYGEDPARVLATTDEELTRELEAAGVSREDVGAEADAFLATLRRRRAPEVAGVPVQAVDRGGKKGR